MNIPEGEPDGYYSLTYTVPAGLDFLYRENRADVVNNLYLSDVDSRKITLSIHKEDNQAVSGTAYLVLRPRMTGVFGSDDLVLNHGVDPSIGTTQDAISITIK